MGRDFTDTIIDSFNQGFHNSWNKSQEMKKQEAGLEQQHQNKIEQMTLYMQYQEELAKEKMNQEHREEVTAQESQPLLVNLASVLGNNSLPIDNKEQIARERIKNLSEAGNLLYSDIDVNSFRINPEKPEEIFYLSKNDGAERRLDVRDLMASNPKATEAYYQAKFRDTDKEMNPYLEKVNKQNSDSAIDGKSFDYIRQDILPKLKANKTMRSVYKTINDIAISNPDLVGSTLYDKSKRKIIENFGLEGSEELGLAKLVSVEFEKMLRPILGAQMAKEEGERVLSKFPSLDAPRSTLINFLKDEFTRLDTMINVDVAKINEYVKDNPRAKVLLEQNETPILKKEIENNDSSDDWLNRKINAQ